MTQQIYGPHVISIHLDRYQLFQTRIPMATPHGRDRNRVSRQRPVACTFCRTRKLRCNRSFPCSSCSSRGLLCQPGYSSTSSEQNRQDDVVIQNSALLARLERLENIVLSGSITTETHTTSPDQCPVPTPASPARRNAHEHEVEDPAIDQLEMLYAAEYPIVSEREVCCFQIQ